MEKSRGKERDFKHGDEVQQLPPQIASCLMAMLNACIYISFIWKKEMITSNIVGHARVPNLYIIYGISLQAQNSLE